MNTVTQPGDIWNIDGHRVLCGDSTTKSIDRLMQGKTVPLLFTSPPYDNQREYKQGSFNWTEMMIGMCKNIPFQDDTQVLINLGLFYRKKEWVMYWDEWMKWMGEHWKRAGWYVWDQGWGLPGDWSGRFAPSHEFVFHFNYNERRPNKIVKSITGGQMVKAGRIDTIRNKKGKADSVYTHAGQPIQDFKIPDSVVRINRQASVGIEVEHPAIFPIPFAEFMIKSFSNEGDIVYEPFAGSGTTLMAAELNKRKCYCVEIAPEYVDIIIRRFYRMFPNSAAILEGTEYNFQEVAQDRGVELPNDDELYRTGTGSKRKEAISTLMEYL